MIDTLKKAFSLLPPKMNTQAAAQVVLAICYQESHLRTRRQIGGGPARGLAQFEKGNQASKGGVWGVMNHYIVGPIAKAVCEQLGVKSDVDSVYNELEFNDVLAFALARLLLWTSPAPLPTTQQAAWDVYLKTWNPGKPRPADWPQSWLAARGLVDGQ
ncbi:hypothetical protein [Pseudomonas phage PMBT14]|uniref:Uncharacterized protein n=1 Tax=Pseudomonas phage PMBT14 TaxID=2059855 RepID=A0A2I6PIA5_9CAUD|nr:hypothetical protein HWB42_gp72 [Pseudomonas phage PMBT14]AUM59790.1 hypothetical protein [Pseudomonas phage PMBT14]